jgi:cytochrome P450
MKLPDKPQTPSWVQTIQAIMYRLEYLEANAQRYGDCFKMRTLGFPPFVVFSNPQAIQEIFTADPNQFASAEANKKTLQPLLGNNALQLHDGDYHRRQRLLLTPPFHGERMQTYGKVICDITNAVINDWTIGESRLVHSLMQEISLRVIIRVVFGIDEDSRFRQVRQLLSLMLNIFNSPLSSTVLFLPFLQKDLGSWSVWGRFLRLRQQINELLYAEIRERREQPDLSRNDILSLMMSARDEDGQPMADEELRDELMSLLFAGHETIASALAWALYWIHYLPEVRDRLLQELEGLGLNPDPTEIARLPYLKAVCSETLRIYPTVLFTSPRIVKSPIQLMGYEFDKGTVLFPCIYLTHHRPELYPEPKRFKPERFLERQFSPYEYFPFGGGNRRCIGIAFAQFEMKLVVATILSRFQLALAHKLPVKPVARGFVITPSGGVPMVALNHLNKRHCASSTFTYVT